MFNSVKRLIKLKSNQGHKDGPAISGVNWKILARDLLDNALHEGLLEIFQTHKTLFPGKIKSEDDIKSSYQNFRTLRRTSDTGVLEVKVDSNDIDIVNRWEGVQASKGKQPGRSMKHHYADIVLLVQPFLRYTSAH